jgi:predicted PhzF superfamily epimerase YddE/YHI9
MRIYYVDAFADRLFSGNPAAVLVLDDWLADNLMQAIAQENNLSETAFTRPRADGDWDLRWFAPAHEVDFCGHATLATAHILFTTGLVAGEVAFHTRVGVLRATQVGQGYRLDLPRLDPVVLPAVPDTIAPLFPVPPVAVFRNFENIFVDLGSGDAVRAFDPDLAMIARLAPLGLAITGREVAGVRGDIASRYFAPAAGIPEDPVTGSIHATLVPYWASKLGRGQVLATQASARGGWLDCTLTDNRVQIVGQAVTYLEGTIRLD